ncbi:unnamed protein product [Caenorhabditis bovis]|uniref:Uncharacterized protein n=1 Tax=Caenorhabditis bovis TaxID=2654633 RepID=A0A8S1F9C7_9PELO|nr:unnamed protein product [Caenorhabditis bovis]
MPSNKSARRGTVVPRIQKKMNSMFQQDHYITVTPLPSTQSRYGLKAHCPLLDVDQHTSNLLFEIQKRRLPSESIDKEKAAKEWDNLSMALSQARIFQTVKVDALEASPLPDIVSLPDISKHAIRLAIVPDITGMTPNFMRMSARQVQTLSLFQILSFSMLLPNYELSQANISKMLLCRKLPFDNNSEATTCSSIFKFIESLPSHTQYAVVQDFFKTILAVAFAKKWILSIQNETEKAVKGMRFEFDGFEKVYDETVSACNFLQMNCDLLMDIEKHDESLKTMYDILNNSTITIPLLKKYSGYRQYQNVFRRIQTVTEKKQMAELLKLKEEMQAYFSNCAKVGRQ